MVDTGFTVPAEKVDRFAACYAPAGRDARATSSSTTPRPARTSGRRTYFSGAGGLVSTAADYLRFCRMLAQRRRARRRADPRPAHARLMATNHLPDGHDLATMARHAGETQREGQGFGLGFAVLLDQTVAQTIGTPGEYYWGGAASTAFFVTPADDLIMIFLTQLRPSSTYPAFRRRLRATVYSSITEP